ncbi:MAG: hypothetical protein ACSHWU_11010, partial [Marinicella sp.]
AMIMPELVYLIDLGGIELILGFMVLYVKSLIAWFELRIAEIKRFIDVVYQTLLNSALSRPHVLSFQVVYSLMVMGITGSVLFSLSFIGPVLLVNSIV